MQKIRVKFTFKQEDIHVEPLPTSHTLQWKPEEIGDNWRKSQNILKNFKTKLTWELKGVKLETFFF